jgi:DNA polymerase beta
MNSQIIQQFELLVQQTESNPQVNRFKVGAYKKTLYILKKTDFEITSIDMLKGINGLGKSSLEKIDEILKTGTCSAIKVKSGDNNLHQLQQLQRITGIGPVKAKKLYLEQKYTLDTLLEMQTQGNKLLKEILTHHQLLGLKYLFDIEKRIPYTEIKSIETFLKRKLSYDLKLVICGSYRRKATTSGDIDIIFYHNDIKTEQDLSNCEENYLEYIIEQLKECRFLIDDLTIKGNTKYMGLCRLTEDSPVRRIDIRFVPKDVLGSAMLYFTGSGDFNKNMRTFALKKGYTINEYGIYYLDTKKKINTKTEEDIFWTLGSEYVEPWDRKSDYIFKE